MYFCNIWDFYLYFDNLLISIAVGVGRRLGGRNKARVMVLRQWSLKRAGRNSWKEPAMTQAFVSYPLICSRVISNVSLLIVSLMCWIWRKGIISSWEMGCFRTSIGCCVDLVGRLYQPRLPNPYGSDCQMCISCMPIFPHLIYKGRNGLWTQSLEAFLDFIWIFPSHVDF